MVSKIILLEGLNWFHGANLTFNSDVGQDKIFGLHERPLTFSLADYSCNCNVKMHLLKSGIRSAMDIYLFNKMLLMANQK